MKRLLLIPLLLLANALSGASWYVATTGDDGADGSIGTPFATPEKARNVASAGDTIYLRGGTYWRTNTLTLASTNSGLTFRGYPGETARLVGGLPLTNWTVWSGSIYTTDVSTQGVSAAFGHLVKDGALQTLARQPNKPSNVHSNWLYVAGTLVSQYTDYGWDSTTVFTNTAGDIPSLSDTTNAQVWIHPRYNWGNSVCKISAVDAVNNKVTLASAAAQAIRPGDRYFVENDLSLLDADGEWFLDETNKFLYIYSPGFSTIWVPVVDTVIGINGATNVTVRNLTIQGANGAIVAATNSVGCSIIANIIRWGGSRSYGHAGIYVDGGSSGTVFGNDVSEVAGNGIHVLGTGNITNRTAANWTVANNYIHAVGLRQKSSVGVYLYGVGNSAKRNTIRDCPNAGIFWRGVDLTVEGNEVFDAVLETDDAGGINSDNSTWLYGRGCVVGNNYIHSVLGYGSFSGTNENPCLGFGIYLDDFTCGVDVRSNVVSHCSGYALFQNGGSENRSTNNIFYLNQHATAHNDNYQIRWSGYLTNSSTWTGRTNAFHNNWAAVEGDPAWAGMRGMADDPVSINWSGLGYTVASNYCINNILVYSNSTPTGWSYILGSVNGADNYMHSNVVYACGAAVKLYSNAVEKTFAEWQTGGQDVGSSTNDPSVNSVTWQVSSGPTGWQRIDTNWGCYYSSDRATWPLGQGGMRYLRAGTIRAGTLRGP